MVYSPLLIWMSYAIPTHILVLDAVLEITKSLCIFIVKYALACSAHFQALAHPERYAIVLNNFG